MISRPAMLLVLGLVAAVPAAVQQLTDNVVTDPREAVFVYEDVERFIGVFDGMTAGADTAAILQAEYLDHGSPGLQTFIEKYGLTAERLLRAIRKYPQKYAAINDNLSALRESEASYRKVYSHNSASCSSRYAS